MKISTILDQIDQSLLFVPAFQREYVWKRQDALSLIDSLIREYPTGSLLTWDTASPPKLKGSVPYNEARGPIKLLLDGQQRVTTLYMIIRGKEPPYYTPAEILNDPRQLHVNVDTLDLSYEAGPLIENDPRWCDLTEVLHNSVVPDQIFAALKEQGTAVDTESVQRVYKNMRQLWLIPERELPEQTIPIGASTRQAIDIFYKVNATGVSLTDAELALAQISGYWPEARDSLVAKLSALADQGFALKLDFLVYALLGCLHHDGSDTSKLHSEDNKEPLQSVWQTLQDSVLDRVVDLLRTKAHVHNSNEITAIDALVPMVVFFYTRHGQAIPEDQVRRIVKWFYYSQIRERYSSQNPQALSFDLRITVGSERPFEELLTQLAGRTRMEVSPEDFVGRPVSHPLSSLLLWYFRSIDAVCPNSGLSLHQAGPEQQRLEHPFIFPLASLEKVGFGTVNSVKYALAQEFTNRLIVAQPSVRTVSREPAADYLASVKVQTPTALERQGVPLETDLWALSRYEDFLRTRRRLLSDRLNDFLASLTLVDEEEASELTLEELVAGGESEVLEFKSSFQWDYQKGRANKEDLNGAVVRTVAAFGNSQGGRLLIGVADDGKPLGLEKDYSVLRRDRDGFEKRLREVLSHAIGKPFVSSHVKITFPSMDGVEACLVKVDPSSSPLVVSGNFYVRNGNSSQKFTLPEFDEYSRNRFP